MLHHAEIVALQLAALVLTAAGWSYWLSRWIGGGIYTATASLCAGWIVLQDLLPAGVRLAQSAWWGAAVAGAGIAAWLFGRLRNRGGLMPSREGWVVAAVFVTVFAVQAAGLVYWGTRDYYGYARQDQVNYTQTAEFLIEKPFATTAADVRFDPWVLEGIGSKYSRIGECVAQGYLAVVTGTDASRSYGTISVFFVALAALAVFDTLRKFGVGLGWSALGGLWTGLLPAITQTQLDGFFSQTATLFCFPLLAQLALGRPLPASNVAPHLPGVADPGFRGNPPRPRLGLAIQAALVLTFLFSTYSEEYVLGAALVALAYSLTPLIPRLMPRLATAVLVILSPWLLLAPFSSHLAAFIFGQYHADQGALAVWQPEAGTWRGWSHVFFPDVANAVGNTALTGLGVALLSVMAWTALGRRERWPMFGIPAAVLLTLALLWHPFPQYAFGKLIVSFAPLAVILGTLGLARWRTGGAGFAIGMVLLAFCSTWLKQSIVFANGLGLQTANWDHARRVYRELDAHPERTYVITEGHGMLAAWLAYHARHARTYSRARIGDEPMDPSLPFMQPPPPNLDYWAVSGGGLTFVPAAARN